MKPSKPAFLKTYGKQKRKLSAWISPDNRKQAFDSTASTDGDVSVFEPVKPARTRRSNAANHRVVRPAKKRAMLCLIERSLNEENIPSPSDPQPAQQGKTTREKKMSVSSGTAVRPAKRKAKLCVTESSSDEENICRPCPPCPQPAQQSKTNSVHPPSAGRFVTRRRRAVVKPKLPIAALSMLNSSDDFTSAALGSRRILKPTTRRRRGRKAPPVLSSAENSVNAAGTASFATNPFRELSLNESADHSLVPCPRKPIFCSTPSADPFMKRQNHKPESITDQSPTPLSMLSTVSCIGVLSTFQEDTDSPVQSVSPPHSEVKLHSSLDEKEPSGDLLLEPKSTNKTSSCSEEAKSHSEGIKNKTAGQLSSLNLLSTDDSERSSRFVSAAGVELQWLIEVLKENCLTERCTVQLERLHSLTVSRLSSQTTYSSCLDLSDAVDNRQTNEDPPSADSVQDIDPRQSSEPLFNLRLSVTNNTSVYSQSINGSESPEDVASQTDNQSTNSSLSAHCKQPVLYVDSSHHIDSSVEFIMGTQLPGTSSGEETVTAKEKCLAKKCTVQLEKCALPQLAYQQLKGLTLRKKAALVCDEKSANPDENKSENGHVNHFSDPEDRACSGEAMASVSQSVNSSSPAAQERSDDSDPEEKAAALKKKCLTDKLIVEVKRITLSQLRENLQLRNTKVRSPTDMSDSASDDKPENDYQSESDTNHCNEDTSAVTANTTQSASTSFEDKIASDKEEVLKNTCSIPHKRKKTSLAPREKKRRSTSADRPGTTRKACVSGLSVSRWKTKGSASTHAFTGRTAQTGGNKAADCSINELLPTQHKQPRELLGTTMNLCTPVKASRLNLSSLLADFTPNTHTWSRLKAALSVHRKGMVLLTPKSLSLSVSGCHGGADLADVSQDLFATPFRTPLSKQLRSQLMSRDSLVNCEDGDLSDAEKVYAECGQQRPLSWEARILPERMKQCVKIGEGTFGEVFSTTNASGDTVALKIIPVEGSEKVNGEDQKTFGEILHEIIISKELSSLKEKQQNQTHGFIGLNDLHCVQGCYPPDFLNAWDAFDQQKGSENDRPDFFEKDQLFIILEFEFGGTDIENSNGTLASLMVAKSILHQVTAALAVAEQELHFEHRDLHWGNVLVKATKQKTGSFLLNGEAHSVETKGVLVRIIDYSLSRLEIDDLTVSCDISEDEELFMGQGDYQFDIYRLMKQENGNNWSSYHPHTNVLWLHYLCSKLLSMRYRGSGGRGAKDMREALTRFYDNILQYSSATEALQNCPMFQ